MMDKYLKGLPFKKEGSNFCNEEDSQEVLNWKILSLIL